MISNVDSLARFLVFTGLLLTRADVRIDLNITCPHGHLSGLGSNGELMESFKGLKLNSIKVGQVHFWVYFVRCL